MQMIFAVKKQENKITEGLKFSRSIFLKKKKDKQFLLLMKGDAVMPQILFLYVEFLDGNNNNNNKDFIYRGGHVTAEKLTNLWPSN